MPEEGVAGKGVLEWDDAVFPDFGVMLSGFVKLSKLTLLAMIQSSISSFIILICDTD